MLYKLLGAATALLLTAPGARAQAPAPPVRPVEIKFGKPEPADFEAKNFAADSGAAAVVLYDFGSTRFAYVNNDFQLVTERVTRIKILKKAGFEAATVEVPLYHQNNSTEKVSDLRGFTYNQPAGGGALEKTKLDIGSAFTEERDKNVRVRKFTLPNVREGSVIEYAYTLTSDFWFNFQDWTFQGEYPTRWSEFRAIIPEYFDYKMLMQGYLSPTLQTREEGNAQYTVQYAGGFTSGGGSAWSGNSGRQQASAETVTARTTVYRWAMQQVPALRPEPYMTTPRDYVARLDFELAGTRMPGQPYRDVTNSWDKINRSLREDDAFGGQLDGAGFLKEQLRPLAAQYPDPAARAAAVRALVVQGIKHDGKSQKYSESVRRAWDQHRGTAADVNLLFIAALRQAGLPAQPVLLSTRAHGRVNQSFPQLQQFNYVVGLLPLEGGQELLLDATDPLLPCGMLPTHCLNQVGRLVPAQGDEPGRWVSLLPSQRFNHFQDVKLTLDPAGSLSGQVHEEQGGYAGAQAREKLQKLGEKKYVTELLSEHPGWEVPTFRFADADKVASPLALHYELRQPAAGPSATPGELYLKPLQWFGESRNPFRHAERNYPVDFGAPTQDVIMLTLTLPAGYTAELPKSASVALPEQGGRYTFSASQPAPGTVQLVSRLSLAKPVYGADEYASLREFYRLVLAKQAEALVVKKM